MKQIVYLKSDPIQHPGQKGRELPLEKSDLFNSIEIEHLYTAALSMETYFHHVFRNKSLNDAYKELMEICADVRNQSAERNALIERRMRSYILEVDIFLKHWQHYFEHIYHSKKNISKPKTPFQRITSKEFDSNESYALICMLRNYLVHSSDVIHGQQIGFDRFVAWADRDVIVNDFNWSSTQEKILLRQNKRIDLLDVITKSLPAVNRIQHELLKCIQTEELRFQCEYLINMSKRTTMITAKAWLIIDFTGIEKVKMPPTYYPNIIGGVPSIGLNYIQLNWKGYQTAWESLMKDMS